jgi:hypothetical protein
VTALRHDACRPRSCERWRQVTSPMRLMYSSERIEGTLRRLTIQGGGSLDLELDHYADKIEPIYR